MKTLGTITLLVWLTFAAAPIDAQERSCSSSDFQSCKSCTELESAIDLKRPYLGDYYRGALWNGLFTAYVLNCPVIGAKLIAAGVNPASGGSWGSMVMTVSSKWPHDDKKINEAWAALLLASKVSIYSRIREMKNKNTKIILQEQSWYEPDYFDIFMLFQK